MLFRSALIALWIVLGLKNLGRVNVIVIAALLILTLVLSAVIFSGGAAPKADGTMTMGQAIELTVAMPLSWLPIISDYTRTAEKPISLAARRATLLSGNFFTRILKRAMALALSSICTKARPCS